MRNIFTAILLLVAATGLRAQQIDSVAVKNTESILASDEMRGRATFTPDIERAADYIESRFRKAGLKTWNGSESYRQKFVMVRATPVSATATLDGDLLPAGHVSAVTSASDLTVDQNSGYEKAFIRAGANFFQEALHFIHARKSYLVLVDSSFSGSFGRIGRFGHQGFKSDRSIVFVLTNSDPSTYSIHIRQEVKESPLANVVGVLPGKSKKDEIVIFSAHYDHLGVGKPDEKGDSIFNGANDDASGTTAVLMLADYFARKKDNERTLVFATFTAEEIGEFGSQYFSGQFGPDSVVAMFNIEMIGTESKWGKNSAYITGYDRSDMGKILEKNLAGSGFTFYPDPYPSQQLFYRSDNASLARLGVPAHTISTSKMDSEKYYHTRGDEIGTLDMANMTRIIQAIAISSSSIVEGKDTPSRVDATQLR
ncbi:MAG TPA: M28 family peptidase [Puia sp.]|nr:M28 family peptidase [Puia sp.]